MTLPSRVRRLERALPGLRARRAEAAERRAAYLLQLPTPFDRWFHHLKLAKSGPANVDYYLSEACVRALLRQARLIGTMYYEEGGEALRDWLRGQEFTDDHGLSEGEVEQILDWCRRVWVKGSSHPYAPWSQTNWLEYEYGELSEEMQKEFADRARRLRDPYDVLARDAAKVPAGRAPAPLQSSFEG